MRKRTHTIRAYPKFTSPYEAMAYAAQQARLKEEKERYAAEHGGDQKVPARKKGAGNGNQRTGR